MALNVSEGNAVNVVVRALTGHGERPSAERLQEAVDLLIKGAHKTLGAGLRPGEITISKEDQ